MVPTNIKAAPTNYRDLENAVSVKMVKVFVIEDPATPTDIDQASLRKLIPVSWGFKPRGYKVVVPRQMYDFYLARPALNITFEGADFELIPALADDNVAGKGARIDTNFKFKAFVKPHTPEFANTPAAHESAREALTASFQKADLVITRVDRAYDNEDVGRPLDFYYLDAIPGPNSDVRHSTTLLHRIAPVFTASNHEINVAPTAAFMQTLGVGMCKKCFKYECPGHGVRTGQSSSSANDLTKKRARARYDDI